jgi:hypothetical protein
MTVRDDIDVFFSLPATSSVGPAPGALQFFQSVAFLIGGSSAKKKGFAASISTRALALACPFDAFRARWDARAVPHVA